MEFAVRKLVNEFSNPRYIYRVSFRHSPGDQWMQVLGTKDYHTREEAEQVLAEIEGA